MPLQFYIKIDPAKPNAMNNALSSFYSVFNLLEETKSVFTGINATQNLHSDPILDESILNVNLSKANMPMSNAKSSNLGTKFKTFNFQKRGSSFSTKLEMPLSHCAGYNFWILKATNLNRGRGIHVFNDLDSLKTLIAEQWNYSESKPAAKDKDESTKSNKVMMIIQKYIERPLLIHKRKFDIRVWVLVGSSGK